MGSINYVNMNGTRIALSTPVGSIIAYGGGEDIDDWLICNGRSFSPEQYPRLFNVIGYSYGRDGDNFRIPDLRESVPVGAGHNETNVFDSTEEDPNTGNPGTQNHDEYTVGQFKDDQFQGHKHQVALSEQKHNGSMQNENNVMTGGITSTSSPVSDGINGAPRIGSTTHGKQLGVNYIIKSA